MEQMNINNYGYTPDQIKEMQAAFKSNDITKAVSITPSADMSVEKAKVNERTANALSQYWLANLKEFGIKRLMRNFSRDYPVKLLQNADGNYISEQLYDLYSDPEQLKKAFEQFFEMYEQPICVGLEGYASSIGKDVESLTDEEINNVIDKVADVINEELIKVVMLGQRVPELFNIGKKNHSEKDYYTNDKGKHIYSWDYINFLNKWNHCKTKLGAPISLDKLFEIDEDCDIEDENEEDDDDSFSKSIENEQKGYEIIRDAFLETLDSIEQEIFYLREDGYTQVEIAKKLGYKNHTPVSKRLKTMRKKWDDFINSIEIKCQ